MKIVTAEFIGASFPPETNVWFETQRSSRRNGTVQRLFPRYAQVAAEDGTLWKVPYRLLKVREPIQEPTMTLSEIDTLGNQLLQKHEDKNDLEPGWRFGFDLAPARGGICRDTEKRITLSVTYCLKASEAEIVDTILHEIAHAIVGPQHGHDAVWKAAAQRIGCTAERCHRVEHTLPRWRGQCGCGKQWKRQRLTRRSRTGLCPACNDKIQWKREGAK